MAHCTRFRCAHCSHSVDSWSDGNPYYIDSKGHKSYAYHPNHELLRRCVGNDSPHLCLTCAEQFKVDSRQPTECCPKCQSNDIMSTGDLAGERCPFCQQGVFDIDPNFFRIS